MLYAMLGIINLSVFEKPKKIAMNIKDKETDTQKVLSLNLDC